MSNPNLTNVVVVDVSTTEYEADLDQGLKDDEVLQPGRHTFKRGGFLARHGIQAGQHAATQKRILLNLDSDVLTYFEKYSGEDNTLQAKINQVLREVMELKQDRPLPQDPHRRQQPHSHYQQYRDHNQQQARAKLRCVIDLEDPAAERPATELSEAECNQRAD